MTWIIGLFVGGIVAVLVWDQFQKPKRRKAAQERDAQRAAAVARLGWKLEVERPDEYVVIHRYSATTDGVPWTFEMQSWKSSRMGENRQTKVFSRWATESVTLREGILAIWPSHGQADKIGPQVPQFIMNLILTPLVRALGGDSRDGELLTQASPVQSDDPTIRSSYLLRATDPRAMHRLLESGARDVLAEAAAWLPVRSATSRLTLAAFWSRGLSVLISGWVDEIPTIEKIVKTGAGLANAYRKMSS